MIEFIEFLVILGCFTGSIAVVWGYQAWYQRIIYKKNRLSYYKLTQEIIAKAHTKYPHDENMLVAYMDGASDTIRLLEDKDIQRKN